MRILSTPLPWITGKNIGWPKSLVLRMQNGPNLVLILYNRARIAEDRWVLSWYWNLLVVGWYDYYRETQAIGPLLNILMGKDSPCEGLGF